MRSRLDAVRNWEQRARRSGYSASKMALKLGVTLRLLEGFFRKRLGATPHEWMLKVRMKLALHLLVAGLPVKVVSVKAGYKQVSHFSREFKRVFGVPPGSYHVLVEIGTAPDENSEAGFAFGETISGLDKKISDLDKRFRI